MKKVYVIVQHRDEVDRLLAPFDSEQIVPNVVNIVSFLDKGRQSLQNELINLKCNYETKDAFIKAHSAPSHTTYRDYILEQIPLFLSNTTEGNAALWNYARNQYDIDDNDLLPNNQFLRRFNPNGKWDYYTVIEPPATSRRVQDIIDTLIASDTNVLLPNYLWINENDPAYHTYTRKKYLEKYKNYRYCLVEYNN